MGLVLLLSVQQFELAHAWLCLGLVLTKLQDFSCFVWRTRKRFPSVLASKEAPEGLSGSMRLCSTCREGIGSRREACGDKVVNAASCVFLWVSPV